MTSHLSTTCTSLTHQRLVAFGGASEFIERESRFTHKVATEATEPKYRVLVQQKGSTGYGLFNTKVEAARAADAIRLKLHGLEGASPWSV